MRINPVIRAMLRSKTAPALVALQIALTLVVLANAVFFARERLNAANRPSGLFDESIVGYLDVTLPGGITHSQILAQRQRDVATLLGVRGVTSASWISQMPMAGPGTSEDARLDHLQSFASAVPDLYFTEPGFEQTLGLQIIEGRGFTANDIAELDPAVDKFVEKYPGNVIVSRAFAQKIFPVSTRYVGKSFLFGLDESAEVRIVGVVERLQTGAAQPSATSEYSVILPWRVSGSRSIYVFRASVETIDRALAEAELAVRSTAPLHTRITARSVTDDRRSRYKRERAAAGIMTVIAVALLAITAVGILALTSLRVIQRRKHIGVRRALGATRLDIANYFVLESALLSAAGIALGSVGILALNHLLASKLGFAPLPLLYLVAGSAAMLLLGLFSVAWPAFAAASTPPAVASRGA